MSQRHLIPLPLREMQLRRRINHSILVGIYATTAGLLRRNGMNDMHTVGMTGW